MMMMVVMVVFGRGCLQRHFGGKLPAGGVPGVNKKTDLWIMKLYRPFDCKHTICAHFEFGVIGNIDCPWLTSASFKTHCRA